MLNFEASGMAGSYDDMPSLQNKELCIGTQEPKTKKSAEFITQTRKKLLEECKASHNSNGKWSNEEQDMLLSALDIFGNNWAAIELFIGTRSYNQIKSHTQKYFTAVKREAIKQLRESNNIEGKLFIITKQHRVNKSNPKITKAIFKQIKEMQKMWVSLRDFQASLLNGEKQEDCINLPVGILPLENDQFEYRRDNIRIESIESPKIFNRFGADEILVPNFSEESRVNVFGNKINPHEINQFILTNQESF